MHRISLQVRVLAYYGLLIAGVVVASLLLVHLHMTRRLRLSVHEQLDTSRRVIEEVLAERAEGLITEASLVAELPVLREAALTWDAASLAGAFREINRLVGSDVIIVTDRMGVIQARSDRRWEPGKTFDEATSVSRALQGGRAASMWVQDRRLYQMVSVPLRLPTGLAGTLSVGYGVDAELARELARLSGNDVAFVVGRRIIAASRSLGDHEAALLVGVAGEPDISGPVYGDVEWRGAVPAVVVSPFFGAGAQPIGAYAVLRSLAADAAAFSALERQLAGSAAAAFLIALAVSFFLSGSVTRPLQLLSVAAGELTSGNYDFPLPRARGSLEVEKLTRAFDSMRRTLKAQIGELRDLNASLEQAVRSRTAALEQALAENSRLLETLRQWNDELERRVEARSRELAEAQQMLIRQDRMAAIGRLAAGVAHEINNPLGILSGFAEGLLDRARDPDLATHRSFRDFPEYLRLIEHEVDRLKTIVQKFLNFARSGSPQKQVIDLGDVGRQVLELLGNFARREGKDLSGRLSATPVWVDADPEQLKQVVLNLALNGLDAVERGGRVSISTAIDGDHGELRVEDDGPGISAEIRERIFEPFFSTKPPEKGTGLGLALCHDLVRENGGTIELVASEPGGGTAFRIRLPMVGTGKLRAHA